MTLLETKIFPVWSLSVLGYSNMQADRLKVEGTYCSLFGLLNFYLGNLGN